MGSGILEPGETFAGYTVERLVGKGGQAFVYLAAHPNLPRKVALKVLSDPLEDDNDVRARFQSEADLAAQLEHPNIVIVYDRGESDGRMWIAMQYVPGADASKVAREAEFDPKLAVRVVTATARALDFAHSRGVLHRDVKPSNILLREPCLSEDSQILLTDFGISKSMGQATNLTKAGFIFGSLPYCSPEQLQRQQIDGAADQYSLACTVFQLLTGHPPFAGQHFGVINAHLHTPPPLLAETDPELAPFDEPVSVALSKDARARFDSCEQFSFALQDALNEYLGDQSRRSEPTEITPLHLLPEQAPTSEIRTGPTIFPNPPNAFNTGPTTYPTGPTTYPTGPRPFPTAPAAFPTGPRPFPTGPTPFPTGPTTFPTGPTTFTGSTPSPTAPTEFWNYPTAQAQAPSSGPQPVQTPAPPSAPEPPAPKKSNAGRAVLATGVVIVLVGLLGLGGWLFLRKDDAAPPEVGLTPIAVIGLNYPIGVEAEADGKIYIADSANNRIVVFDKVTQTQQVLGLDGLKKPTDVDVASDGTVYVADAGNNRIVSWNGQSQQTLDLGPLRTPSGVAIDENDALYVADTGHARVLLVRPGSPVETVGFTNLAAPVGIDVADGEVVVSEPDTGRVVRLGADGQSAETGLSEPIGVALDGEVLYVAENAAARLTRIVNHSKEVALQSGLHTPSGVSFAGGTVYVVDSSANQVIAFSP